MASKETVAMICLSEKGCQKNGVGIGEALLLLLIHNKADLETARSNLTKEGYITAASYGLFQENEWRLTGKGKELLDSIIMESSEKQEPNERLSRLAKGLKEIFPKGKKDGTNYYWADGVALIMRRLKLFFKKYGNTYTDEQIIKAASKYVEGFNGNYTYMRLLKYFIFKEKVGAAGEVEGESELINYIENAGQEENLRNDWTSTLK